MIYLNRSQINVHQQSEAQIFWRKQNQTIAPEIVEIKNFNEVTEKRGSRNINTLC